jgi:GntR family transcriptional regulator
MIMTTQFKENNAIYQQIADRLKGDIMQGHYREEERIPSVREYAAMMEVNINTALRAYDALQQQGVIYNKRGLGYFVSAGAGESLLSEQRRSFVNVELPELFERMHALGVTMEEVVREYEKGASR